MLFTTAQLMLYFHNNYVKCEATMTSVLSHHFI